MFNRVSKLILGYILLPLSVFAQGGPPPAIVVIAHAEERQLAPHVWYAGAVISQNDAKVATEVEGRLVWIVELGTRIDLGQPMARLDDTFLNQRLLEQKAEVSKEQAHVEFFNKEVKRLSKLAHQNNTAQRQLDQAISDRAVSQSDLLAAQSRLHWTREQLERTEIKAPFTGFIVERYKQTGEWATEGDQIVRLVDTQALEIQTRVPVTILAHLQINHVVDIKSEQKSGKAKIQNIVPVGDDRSRLFELRMKPITSTWAAGQNVRVAVPTAKERPAIVVPRDALVLRSDGTKVFRINDDNKAEAVVVKTGLADGALIEISGEIQVGDRIVTRGGERLRTGQVVKIKNGNTAS